MDMFALKFTKLQCNNWKREPECSKCNSCLTLVSWLSFLLLANCMSLHWGQVLEKTKAKSSQLRLQLKLKSWRNLKWWAPKDRHQKSKPGSSLMSATLRGRRLWGDRWKSGTGRGLFSHFLKGICIGAFGSFRRKMVTSVGHKKVNIMRRHVRCFLKVCGILRVKIITGCGRETVNPKDPLQVCNGPRMFQNEEVINHCHLPRRLVSLHPEIEDTLESSWNRPIGWHRRRAGVISGCWCRSWSCEDGFNLVDPPFQSSQSHIDVAAIATPGCIAQWRHWRWWMKKMLILKVSSVTTHCLVNWGCKWRLVLSCVCLGAQQREPKINISQPWSSNVSGLFSTATSLNIKDIKNQKYTRARNARLWLSDFEHARKVTKRNKRKRNTRNPFW